MLRGPLPFALASVLLILAASCGGRALPEGDAGAVTMPSGSSGGAQDSSGSSGGSSSSGDADGDGDGGVSFDAGCPGGTFSGVIDLYTCASDVAGRWAGCAGSSAETLHRFGNSPADTVGLEFGPATMSGGGCSASSSTCEGGNLYFLVQGPTGLVRGEGSEYQASYACSAEFFWLSNSGARSTAESLNAPNPPSTNPDQLLITWTDCDFTLIERIP